MSLGRRCGAQRCTLIDGKNAESRRPGVPVSVGRNGHCASISAIMAIARVIVGCGSGAPVWEWRGASSPSTIPPGGEGSRLGSHHSRQDAGRTGASTRRGSGRSSRCCNGRGPRTSPGRGCVALPETHRGPAPPASSQRLPGLPDDTRRHAPGRHSRRDGFLALRSPKRTDCHTCVLARSVSSLFLLFQTLNISLQTLQLYEPCYLLWVFLYFLGQGPVIVF